MKNTATIIDIKTRQKPGGGYSGRPDETVVTISLELKALAPVDPMDFDRWADSYGTDGGRELARAWRSEHPTDSNDAPPKAKPKKGRSWQRCDACATWLEMPVEPANADDDATAFTDAWEEHETACRPTCAAGHVIGDDDTDHVGCVTPAEAGLRDALAYAYGAYRAGVDQANAATLNTARDLGMLMLLLRKEVTIELTPLQQGFADLLALAAP